MLDNQTRNVDRKLSLNLKLAGEISWIRDAGIRLEATAKVSGRSSSLLGIETDPNGSSKLSSLIKGTNYVCNYLNY